MVQVNALDDLQQMADEIIDGRGALNEARAAQRPVTQARAETRDLEEEVKYLERSFTVKRLRVEAAIAGVTPQFEGDAPRLQAIRERLRRSA